ncbi:hypothetical protein ACU6RQ_08025 [Zobellella denitrificans]
MLSKIEDLIDIKLNLEIESKQANLSYSELEMELALIGNKLLKDKNQKIKFHEFIKSNYSLTHGFQKPTLIPKEERETIAQRYLADIREIINLSKTKGNVNFISTSCM